MTHPDSDVLAEFHAGLITGRRGARISAHLAACERCATVCDELAGISALLAGVPVPAMPDAVVRRLEAVLATEAAQRDDSERTVGDSSRHRAASPPPRRHWDLRLVALRVLAPAAAVVLLAAGGYGLSRIGASSTSSVAAGSEAAPAASARAGAAAVVPSSAATSRPEAAPLERPARFGIVISGTDYLHATLQQQLKYELQLHAAAAGTVRQLPPGPVKGCVLMVTKGIGPVTLVLVEQARYQGQPANVIIAATDHHDVAWVTTSGCSASSGHILATTTL